MVKDEDISTLNWPSSGHIRGSSITSTSVVYNRRRELKAQLVFIISIQSLNCSIHLFSYVPSPSSTLICNGFDSVYDANPMPTSIVLVVHKELNSTSEAVLVCASVDCVPTCNMHHDSPIDRSTTISNNKFRVRIIVSLSCITEYALTFLWEVRLHLMKLL